MIENLVVRLIANNASFKQSIKQSTNLLDKFASRAAAAGKTIAIGAGASIAGLGTVAVMSAAKTEKLKISMEALAGSAAAGNKQFEKLRKFSSVTPFRFNDLVKANNTLMGFGQTTDEAYASVEQLANIAAITGADLNALAVPLAQSAAAGRVMTEDLNQFVNNGVPIYRLLGDITGKNAGQLRKMASDGELSFSILNEAFVKATSKGGVFFEGVNKQSDTFLGKISTLVDNLQLLGEKIATPVMDNYLKPMLDSAIALTKQLQDIGLDGLIESMAAMVPTFKQFEDGYAVFASFMVDATEFAIRTVTRMFLAFSGWLNANWQKTWQVEFPKSVMKGLQIVSQPLNSFTGWLGKKMYDAVRGKMNTTGFNADVNVNEDIARGANSQNLLRTLGEIGREEAATFMKGRAKLEIDSSKDPVAKDTNEQAKRQTRLLGEIAAATQARQQFMPVNL